MNWLHQFNDSGQNPRCRWTRIGVRSGGAGAAYECRMHVQCRRRVVVTVGPNGEDLQAVVKGQHAAQARTRLETDAMFVSKPYVHPAETRVRVRECSSEQESGAYE